LGVFKGGEFQSSAVCCAAFHSAIAGLPILKIVVVVMRRGC
jgi:hypothetical protein